ncbi:MAG: DUF748 domain-containing protein, partial [Proteobacteria bacterium]|nr:DUF748 domain-containing protein [Pseudomonadota bacterium]MBU1711081.1 DUF748 domain-containing protein [Pseudomonadota bacterium]
MNESNRDNPLGSIPINEKQENGKDLPQGLIPPLTPPPSFPRKSDPPSSKPFRVIKWTAFVVLFAVAFYFLAGFLLIPYYLQTFLPKQLEKILDRPINIASTGFNPITLTMTFQNGIVGPKRNSPEDFVDPLLSFGKISVDFELLSFMKKGFIAKSTNIDQLFIHCVRNKENKYNILEISNALQHHLAGTGSLPAGAPLSTGPSLFSLNNLVVTRSSVTFDDLPSGKTHTIKEINLAIPVLTNFSFQMEDLIKPSFSAIINDSPIRMKGDTRIKDDSIEANLELNLTDIDLPEYLAYLPSNSDFLVTKGKADLTLNLTFKTSDKKSQLGIDGAGKISDLRLNDKSGKNLATIPELQISGNFIPLAKTYHITNLVLNNPKILIERDPGGKLNIPVQSPAKEASAASQIKLRIDNILVKNGDLSFIDQSVKGGFAASWKDCGFTFESPATDPAKP